MDNKEIAKFFGIIFAVLLIGLAIGGAIIFAIVKFIMWAVGA